MLGHLVLGRYEIVRLLGEGTMGRAFLATDRDLNRDVVVKVMHDTVAEQPKFRELFEREMQLMSRLHHPNIVELYDTSADDDGLCIIMEYVAGTDLEELLQKQKRFPLQRVGRYLGQLCSALYTAHGQGIIHRDLKPANMMVVDPGSAQERIKVMDFGLAKITGGVYISLEKLQGTETTIASGTAEYMAPEQVRGDELDHRSDIYGLGCIMFELLTGKLPFIRSTIDELLLAHAEDPVPTFAAVGARGVVPAPVEALILNCMCKYPVERPHDAWELAERFEKAAGMRILEGPRPEIVHQAPVSPAFTADDDDEEETAVIHRLEARWGSERTAVIKIKGFVDDAGGEVIESVPGMIRMLFGQPGCKYKAPKIKSGAFSWFGLSKPELIQVDLQIAKRGGQAGNLVDLKVMLFPADGSPLPDNAAWHDMCSRIYTDLRAYLIS
jgi:serine/threonine-protein kinase